MVVSTGIASFHASTTIEMSLRLGVYLTVVYANTVRLRFKIWLHLPLRYVQLSNKMFDANMNGRPTWTFLSNCSPSTIDKTKPNCSWSDCGDTKHLIIIFNHDNIWSLTSDPPNHYPEVKLKWKKIIWEVPRRAAQGLSDPTVAQGPPFGPLLGNSHLTYPPYVVTSDP